MGPSPYRCAPPADNALYATLRPSVREVNTRIRRRAAGASSPSSSAGMKRGHLERFAPSAGDRPLAARRTSTQGEYERLIAPPFGDCALVPRTQLLRPLASREAEVVAVDVNSVAVAAAQQNVELN